MLGKFYSGLRQGSQMLWALSGEIKKMKKIITALITLSVLPAFALADSATVINNVSSSVSTGGNKVENGEVTQGSSRSGVKVYTEVNGEVIEDFQKEVSGGEEINYENKKEFDGGSVETKVEVNGEVNREATSSLIATSSVSKAPFDMFREEVTKFIKYVFSLFKF